MLGVTKGDLQAELVGRKYFSNVDSIHSNCCPLFLWLLSTVWCQSDVVWLLSTTESVQLCLALCIAFSVWRGKVGVRVVAVLHLWSSCVLSMLSKHILMVTLVTH